MGVAQVFALTDWKAGFHLFGYSDKQQWSVDGSMLLGMRTMLSPRDLAIDSRAEIGMIPFSTGVRISSPVKRDSRFKSSVSGSLSFALALILRLVALSI